MQLIKQHNQGEGSAVRNGIKRSTGDYLLVQDAEPEHDPQDYLPMLEVLNSQRTAIAVYSSRTMNVASGHKIFRSKHPEQGFGQWFAGRLLSLWAFLLFGRYISDTLTA